MKILQTIPVKNTPADNFYCHIVKWPVCIPFEAIVPFVECLIQYDLQSLPLLVGDRLVGIPTDEILHRTVSSDELIVNGGIVLHPVLMLIVINTVIPYPVTGGNIFTRNISRRISSSFK